MVECNAKGEMDMETIIKDIQTAKETGARVPSRENCLRLLDRYGTPLHVVNHCLAVTDTALRIGRALNAMGHNLDLEKLESAALLHDIARVEENHGVKGADLAESLGYEEIADLIRCHMTYSTDPAKLDISELDILCLADRMVKENTYVGIEERMEYILEKFKNDPIARERIMQRRGEIQKLCERIETLIGTSMDELMT